MPCKHSEADILFPGVCVCDMDWSALVAFAGLAFGLLSVVPQAVAYWWVR